LVATDSQLADWLTGGTPVSGSRNDAVYVRSGWQSWKTNRKTESIRSSDPDAYQDPLIQEIRRLLDLSKNDIQELWEHPVVKGLIANRRLKLDEWSEFFLKQINRIAAPDYLPLTDDILHARVQTLGVSQHSFDVGVRGSFVPWHLYDVGGARGQRHTWVPYFDDANAIIFIAPVSAFDQFLEEDPQVNRIDDSLKLFTHICSNALLKNVNLVLFLNKLDLLKEKLEKGTQVRKYMPSFGDRPNDLKTVMKYLRAHFMKVHRKNDTNNRSLFVHFTSVVDTTTTRDIIGSVCDSVLREQVQTSGLV